MEAFTSKVIQIIKKIPYGKVMTYGQVAQYAGKSRNARQVAYILHGMSAKHELPWHRVVNSKGKVSLKGDMYDLQKALLEGEGIGFDNYDAIDLKQYSC
ncbi:MAG: MGMT family protein [Clostridia bacterium]|nr:MGMT family protein [Clostridia bacterium]